MYLIGDRSGPGFKKTGDHEYVCVTWFERDRQNVRLETPRGRVIFDLWDEEDEFFYDVLHTPDGSLLDFTCKRVIQHQIEYAQGSTPWGISESAFYVRDRAFTYQYADFGVPGLGLKRGLEQDRVIAPYATALAVMAAVRPLIRRRVTREVGAVLNAPVRPQVG